MAIILGIAIISCQNNKKGSDLNMDNPFFRNWTTTFGVPPFDEIKEEHYLPAVKEGIGQHEKEINNIIDNSEEPTFENTILELDKSGEFLDKVTGVFFPLNSANTNDSMQAVAREILPLLPKHSDNISLNPALFKKIKEKAGLSRENEKLKLANRILSKSDENMEAGKKINKIVREIDKCIALLNK